MKTYDLGKFRFRIREKRNRQGETVDTVAVTATEAMATVQDLIDSVNELETTLLAEQGGSI